VISTNSNLLKKIQKRLKIAKKIAGEDSKEVCGRA
jgi:hypothetical protein